MTPRLRLLETFWCENTLLDLMKEQSRHGSWSEQNTVASRAGAGYGELKESEKGLKGHKMFIHFRSQITSVVCVTWT